MKTKPKTGRTVPASPEVQLGEFINKFDARNKTLIGTVRAARFENDG